MTKNLLPAAVAAVLLWACSGGTPGGEAAANAAEVDPASLCVSSSCGLKTRLVAIPNAENTLFTPDGRLFVSGGTNVFEVTKDAAGAFHAAPLYAGSCNFTGMALRGSVLYVTCFDLRLYAADTSQAKPALKPIWNLSGMSAPNGVAQGPNSEVYIVDGPLSQHLPSPKIVRLEFDSADPLKVARQTDWLPSGLQFPNGLTIKGDTLYITDSTPLPPVLTRILSVQIMPDGSPGPLRVVASLDLGIPDDLTTVGADLLVALYSTGSVALIGADGKVVAQTDPLTLDLPSSVKLGQPPMFAPTDLVITEKGLLDVAENSSFGNALSVFRRK